MKLRVGDHLVVSRRFYSHHGIYVGRGMVIHFFSSLKQKLKAIVRRDSLEDFCDGGSYCVVPYSRSSKSATVLRRARDLLGTASYCLITNNCEHLARFCKTGRKISYQVRRFCQGMCFGAAGAPLFLLKKARTLFWLLGAASIGALTGGLVLYGIHRWLGF